MLEFFGSQWVPQVSNVFPITPHFILYALYNLSSSWNVYRHTNMGSCMFLMYGVNTFIGIGGDSKFFRDGPIKDTHHQAGFFFFFFFGGGLNFGCAHN